MLAALLPAREALLADAAGVALSAATLFFVPPSPPYASDVRERAHVRDRWDLFVTMIGRAWIVLGMTLLNTYVLFFFHDVLGIGNASFNTGLVAGSAMRTVLDLAGVTDVVTKIHSRSKNKLTIARATVEALKKLRAK